MINSHCAMQSWAKCERFVLYPSIPLRMRNMHLRVGPVMGCFPKMIVCIVLKKDVDCIYRFFMWLHGTQIDKEARALIFSKRKK